MHFKNPDCLKEYEYIYQKIKKRLNNAKINCNIKTRWSRGFKISRI